MKKPNFRDFHTNDGMHSAMREYAKQFAQSDVAVCVEYSDGSIDDCFHIFAPFQKAVEYKTPDGELWEQLIDTAKYNGDWIFDFKPMTKKQLLAELPDYINSLGNDIVDSVVRVWIKSE